MYNELIITSKKARVRKSCYPCILRLRHQSLIVYSRAKLVYVHLLYDDIYSVQIWITSFKCVWYKYQIQEHRVQVRIGSATPPAVYVRFKSHFKLSTNCTIVVIRQVKIMIKIPIISNVDLSAINRVQKRGTVVCKLEI